MPGLSFDEEIFVWALASRSPDARKFRTIFHSIWLEQTELIPILDAIYNFVGEHTISPSLSTIEKIFKDKDETIYNVRIKPVIQKLQSLNPDASEILFTLNKAKDVAAIRSFNDLFRDERIIESIDKVDGKGLLEEIYKWLNHFSDSSNEQTLNIKEALDNLVSSSIASRYRDKIASGIECLDRWSGGGLRSPQLGILMAPTGGGKSAVLMNIAYRMAFIEQAPVWFVTNELDMNEQAERFLARITGNPMLDIQSDPSLAYAESIKHWDSSIDKNLKITDVGLYKNTTVNDLESILNRWTNLTGWMPRVLVLDYMGRMCPAERGYKRDQEWQWYGGIARDLVKFAKKYNLIIWTACQTNRSGLNVKGDMDMTMASASVRHFEEASMVVAANQVKIVGSLNDPTESTLGLQFKPLKARHAGLATKGEVVHINLSTMLISNKVASLEEEKEEDSISGMIKKK